jgi:hypothetical protein
VDVFQDTINDATFLFVSLFLVLWSVVLAWLVHRLAAALATSWWLVRKTLPDYGRAVKVIGYESSFIWTLSCLWGLLSLSYIVHMSWISELLGWSPWNSPLLGMPAEVAAYFVGTAAIGAIWVCRFLTAGKAIRWSNF